jgi:hypothetical protein
VAEWCSSQGCDGRRDARTQGAPIAAAIGATEDAAARMPSAALRHSHYFAKPSYYEDAHQRETAFVSFETFSVTRPIVICASGATAAR